MAFNSFCTIVSLMITSAVELSVCIGVDSCGRFISLSMLHIGIASFTLMKVAPNLASYSDGMMCRMIVEKLCMDPLFF